LTLVLYLPFIMLCLEIIYSIISLLYVFSGLFHVIGPKKPVIALVGGEALLPCHLSPSMDAQGMKVMWHLNHLSEVVHYYGNFQDDLQQQSPEYQGRTELLKENITKGQVALRIHPIHVSDEGEYSCSFASSTHSGEAQLEVTVTASGIAPHIHIEPSSTRGIKLTCKSTGWYPEPEVQWRDPKGQPLTWETETMTKEENGLVLVESSITVDERSRENPSCFIKNPVLNVEKGAYMSIAHPVWRAIKYTWFFALSLIIPVLLIYYEDAG
uniref:Ig-like domain-containing protein n=1 Tax=Otolemur garnettii TaxID=30611 RepID=H0XN66_OTOGA